MKHFLCLAFGLLMAVVVHAADDVGINYDQPTVVTISDFRAVADVPMLASDYITAQPVCLLMQPVCLPAVSVAPVNTSAVQFTFHADAGRASEPMAVPRCPINSKMRFSRFVPPNVTLSAMMTRHTSHYFRKH